MTDPHTTPVDKCMELTKAALKELYDLSPNERPMEDVGEKGQAYDWLTKWICRAYIEGQKYVTG